VAAIAASQRETFRILHFSIQRTHLHLIIEADSAKARADGLKSLSGRITRRANRLLDRRGTLWADRPHVRPIKSPREMRTLLVYVLANHRKHDPRATGLDPAASGFWFDGWREPIPRPPGPSPVAAPHTWLASVGWRRLGLIGAREAPRAG
jgi:hypothetical protein